MVRSSKAAPVTEPGGAIGLKEADTFGFRFRLVSNLIQRDFTTRFAQVGLTQITWTIMVLIERNPGLRPADIGSLIGIRQANLVDLLEGLVTRGVIQRVPLVSDRRSHGLFLSASGTRLLKKAWKCHAEHNDYLKSLLGDRFGEFSELLKEMIAALKSEKLAPEEPVGGQTKRPRTTKLR